MRRRGTVRKQQLGATGLRPGKGKQGTTFRPPPAPWEPSREDPMTHKWMEGKSEASSTGPHSLGVT